ncbi:MAG TPA: WecB/TagA/CpsF family glycosyltransferase [Acidimicrobiales bacterium]|nr:WecB/TagA/CpsF family glycosyltransferase [Acidimicrobiales bacterium]
MTTQPPTVRIGPIEIHEVTTTSVVDHVRDALRAGEGGRIATPNVDHLYRAERDAECQRLLETADLRVADGMPLVWASRLQGTPLAERVAGADLVWSLTELARREGVPLVLLGGTEDSVHVAAERLRRYAPGVEIIAHSPPVGFEGDPEEQRRIEKLLDPEGSGIVLCGLGFPKQERLAERLRTRYPDYWFVGCGAAINMVGGRAARAPRLLQRLGLEWVYRLAQEPRRLFRRYLLHDLPFALVLMARAMLSRRSPSARPAASGPDSAEPTRPPVFIAWGLVGRRAHELAAELGADVLACYPPGGPARPPVLRRYLLSTLATARYLVARRPSAVIVTNPPIIPSLLALAYTSLTGRPLVVDDHPGAFGAMGYTVGKRLEPLHKMVARRARGCLVTDAQWVDVVRSWGGRGVILHESPGTIEPAPRRTCREHPEILFVSVFARDEPVDEVLGAARLVPEMRVRVTGDRAKAPQVPVPDNVELVGLLDFDDYVEALRGADVVLALTTEPTSAMRAGFEAIWAEKVLVVSDWPLSKELFPSAVPVANTAEAIAAGLREAVADHAALTGRSRDARGEQLAKWEEQVSELQSLLRRDH